MILTDSNIQISKLVSQLKRHEGYRNRPYEDTTGNLTIGYGRNLDSHGIHKDEAELMLQNDIVKAIERLERYPWWEELGEARQRALADMIFNLGSAGFAGFKRMIAAISRCDYDTAADEMLDSQWARQVGRRSEYIANLMKQGDPN